MIRWGVATFPSSRQERPPPGARTRPDAAAPQLLWQRLPCNGGGSYQPLFAAGPDPISLKAPPSAKGEIRIRLFGAGGLSVVSMEADVPVQVISREVGMKEKEKQKGGELYA